MSRRTIASHRQGEKSGTTSEKRQAAKKDRKNRFGEDPNYKVKGGIRQYGTSKIVF